MRLRFRFELPIFADCTVVVINLGGLDRTPKRIGIPEEYLAHHHPSKTRRLFNNSDIYRCWSWWRHVRGLKLEDRLQSGDCLTFPETMLGLPKFGSTMFVRESYKDLYNKVKWNQPWDPPTTSSHSYIITGTPGKFTVHPFALTCLY